jgi:hypothetical protein
MVEGVFADAQSAMERGDWDAFFRCLDRRSLLKIAKNSFQGIVNSDIDQDMLNRHGISIEVIQRIRATWQSLAMSAAEVVGTIDPGAKTQKSLDHKQAVDAYDKYLDDTLESVADLPGFTATLERAMRASLGGGSVAADMFIGETLQDIAITGKTAWAMRRIEGGYSEDLKFVQQQGQWRIQLLARGRRRG